METVRYFAYGSNLNRADFALRTGMPKTTLRPVKRVWLPDHQLAFSRYSQSRKGGALDVIPRQGHVVDGMLFEINADDLPTLDKKEGAPRYYERIDCITIDDRGEWTPAITYRVKAMHCQPHVAPNPKYVQIVCDGRREFDLDTESVRNAAANRPTAPVDAFFFYGTFLRGEARFSLLQSHGISCILLAKTFGRMVDLGEFPGLIEADHASSIVHGEFVRLNDSEKLMPILDRIEGFRGYVPNTDSLFRRTLISCDVGDGRIRQAWTYVWTETDIAHDPIVAGCWREYRGRRRHFIERLVATHVGEDERGFATKLAAVIPFSFDEDRDRVIDSLLPIADAVWREEVSERRLAQHSGLWSVNP